MERNFLSHYKLTLVLALIIMFKTATVTGNVIKVPQDYSRIQLAIDASEQGDIIEVAGGEYSENLEIDKSISIVSISSDYTVLISQEWINSQTVGGVGIHIMSANSVVIHGFIIERYNVGINTYNSENVTIENCFIRDNFGSDYEHPTGFGVSISESNNVILKNNLIIHNCAYLDGGGGCGVKILSSENVSIINNTISHNDGENGAIYGSGWGLLVDSSSCTIKNNIISNNDFKWGAAWPGVYGCGIESVNGSILDISYNNVFDNSDDYGNVNNYENTDTGENDISKDPLFTNDVTPYPFEHGDYHLQESSPCIDAGDPAPEYNDQDGTRNDIGAFGGPMLPTTTFIQNDGCYSQTFQLFNNYPNPFNPSTTIKYNIKKPTYVNLSIYNIAGQFVETLVDCRQTTGEHQATWQPKNLASGVYIYKIQTNDFSEVKKLIYQK